MICPLCNTDLEEFDNYCFNCGYRINPSFPKNKQVLSFLIDLFQYNQELSDGAKTRIKDYIFRVSNETKPVIGLALDNLGLQSLPDSLAKLKDLTYLILSLNKFSTFPKIITELAHLEILLFSQSQLKDVPESFGDLINIKETDLSSNFIQDLPESFGNLINLKKINFYQNEITSLPESFGNLINLTELILSENRIQSLPESFGNLVNLTDLDLGANKIQRLPESFGNLINLNELELSVNKIQSLPESICNLSKLNRFYISENQLEYLPELFGNISSKAIEPEIEDFYFIIYLDNNKIVSLPLSMKNLPEKGELYLRENCLEEISDWMWDSNPKKLIALDGNPVLNTPEGKPWINEKKHLFDGFDFFVGEYSKY